MKEDSDRESELEKWAKQTKNSFWIRFWVVEFLSKFQSDPTVGSKVTPLFVKHAHIASLIFALLDKSSLNNDEMFGRCRTALTDN
jgi:hypothetical protein